MRTILPFFGSLVLLFSFFIREEILMYNLSSSLYPLGLIEFVQKVKGLFVLNGAFCTVDTGHTTPAVLTPGTVPPLFNSAGLNYTSHPSITAASIPTSTNLANLTEDNFVVHFTFYQKYEPALTEDVSGEIYFKDGQYVVHIANATKILSVLEHDDVVIRTTILGPMTVEKLRDILGKIRTFYFLEALDKLHDVLPVPSTDPELEEVLEKIKEYILLVSQKDYVFDMCTATSVDSKQKKLLTLKIHKKDASESFKELVVIELFPRKYEPTILLKTYFENDNDPFKGIFKFLEQSKAPLKLEKVISPKEADYFIKGVMKAHHDLHDYKFVIKKS